MECIALYIVIEMYCIAFCNNVYLFKLKPKEKKTGKTKEKIEKKEKRKTKENKNKNVLIRLYFVRNSDEQIPDIHLETIDYCNNRIEPFLK